MCIKRFLYTNSRRKTSKSTVDCGLQSPDIVIFYTLDLYKFFVLVNKQKKQKKTTLIYIVISKWSVFI